MRRPLVAGNWKMHKTAQETERFLASLAPRVKPGGPVEVAVAPAFTALETAQRVALGSGIAIAAQNVHPEPQGAFTGEVSARMLAALGCRYVIVGHSERRALFGETSELVARKARAVRAAGMRPIVCVGETLEEREAGRTEAVVSGQLRVSFAGFGIGDAEDLVVAYEPVWAIGTGRTATPGIAQETHAFIRTELRRLLRHAAESVRIQYGGSVKPENARELLAQPDVDGALVGGASLDLESFWAIIASSETVEDAG